MKLHAWEHAVEEEALASLIGQQFPHWSALPLQRVRSTGTVNHIFRLGDDLAVRVPRTSDWGDDLERELTWLPRLAGHLPLLVPAPLARGKPGAGVTVPWAVFRWLEGTPYDTTLVRDEGEAAEELAAFVLALRRVPTSGAPGAGRRPLQDLDAATRAALSAADGIDTGAALQAWERALLAPPWDGRSVWIHADLLRPNLLVTAGRLSAVLDFGSVGVGDPAADIAAAWNVFGPAGRRTYLQALAVDQGTADRARGYALHQAALIIPYYANSNAGLAAHARRSVEQVLLD